MVTCTCQDLIFADIDIYFKMKMTLFILLITSIKEKQERFKVARIFFSGQIQNIIPIFESIANVNKNGKTNINYK